MRRYQIIFFKLILCITLFRFILYKDKLYYSIDRATTSPIQNAVDITSSYSNRQQIKNELAKWVNRHEFKVDLIHKRHSWDKTWDSLYDTKFDLVIYNRVAKCGSTTTKLMLEALSTVLNYTFIEKHNKTGTEEYDHKVKHLSFRS